MGFKKTVIYGGKCDCCGVDRLYRIENADYYDNPSRTSTGDMFKRDGWEIRGKSWYCPDCAEERKKARKKHGE